MIISFRNQIHEETAVLIFEEFILGVKLKVMSRRKKSERKQRKKFYHKKPCDVPVHMCMKKTLIKQWKCSYFTQ